MIEKRLDEEFVYEFTIAETKRHKTYYRETDGTVKPHKSDGYYLIDYSPKI